MSVESFADYQDFTPPTGDSSFVNAQGPSPAELLRAKNAEKVRAQARAIRTTTKTVILTRKQLKTYLLSKGLDLVTSAVEFDRYRSFIRSSYIVYLQHDSTMEPLAHFMQRYPQFTPTINEIEKKLQNIGGTMNLKDAFVEI